VDADELLCTDELLTGGDNRRRAYERLVTPNSGCDGLIASKLIYDRARGQTKYLT
jgi:hypothetical protein